LNTSGSTTMPSAFAGIAARNREATPVTLVVFAA
jgi:hypothetical protein